MDLHKVSQLTGYKPEFNIDLFLRLLDYICYPTLTRTK